MKKNISLDSLCVKEASPNHSTKPHQLPIYATSSFAFDSLDDSIDVFSGKREAHSYSRYGNPTIDTVAQKIANLESFGMDVDVYGFLTSSGMSAISTILLSTLQKGDKILTQSNLYGGTTVLFKEVLRRLGISPIFINMEDKDLVTRTLHSDKYIKLLYIETPANPTMSCVDIRWISSVAKENGKLTVIDNTFCTPILQQPLTMGIDFVIHSTTKYINGHGNAISGVIIGHREDYKKRIWNTLKLLGSTCNAWDAWLINNGIKTLSLRMERHSCNALRLSEFLDDHPRVNKVNYNGLPDHPYHDLAKRQMKAFGGMLSFEINSGMQGALNFMNKLEFCTLAPTLGDVDTLILHPATSSHIGVDKKVRIENGISDGLIRVSTGIESVEDIISDIEQALE